MGLAGMLTTQSRFETRTAIFAKLITSRAYENRLNGYEPERTIYTLSDGITTLPTDLSRVTVVATTKSTFAGAATIKTRFLSQLQALGAEVTLVAERIPPAVTASHPTLRVRALDLTHVKSTAKGALELLQSFLVQALVDECQKCAKLNKTVVLWGSHLFPYGAACIQAKRILRAKDIEVPLIVFPVGSDIWEIGSAIPDVTRDILSSPEIDVLATYSAQFAAEIAHIMGQQTAEIRCILPFISPQEYPSATKERRAVLRRSIGIPPEATVFINHSNMRPVKRVDFCVDLVNAIAKSVPSCKTFLILLGPAFPLTANPDTATVIQIPTTSPVPDFLAMSDFSVNASLHDSFNTALLEAMSCGAIPVTSDRPAIASFIREAQAGVVFTTTKQHDCLQEEISDHYPISQSEIKKLLGIFQTIDEQSLKEYRRKGQDLVSRTFSEQAGATALASLIKNAIMVNQKRHAPQNNLR